MNLCTLGERALKDHGADHNLNGRVERSRCRPTQATASPEKKAQAHHREQHANHASRVLVSHVHLGHPFSNHGPSNANGELSGRGMGANGCVRRTSPHARLSEGSRGHVSEICYRLGGGWKSNNGGMSGDVPGTPGLIRETG